VKVLRQLPGGVQAGFIVDRPKFKPETKIGNADFLYNMEYVWSVVLEPPVIFYTYSNKRRGIFKVVDRPILNKINIDNPQDWLVFPIYVNNKLIFVVVDKEYFAMATGLANLYEFADFESLENRRPDGIYIFGMNKSFFEDEDDYNGIIYKEDDGTYVGLVGDDPSIDYFGYMKKMVLTIHNLTVIDEDRLPIHGALADIKLRDGQSFNVMIMGDSGAGKSETLDALNRIRKQVSEVNILIDDMGSLDILEDGTVVAYGTETGAFVRLDDLQPGYAYSAMDRSIFMNPNITNARVIVPYSNYEDIIRPTKIDYFFYANNYEKIDGNKPPIEFFDDVDKALDVFSKGARMAKGTTSEKGLTYSYFANPFGAIQRREKHEKIARRYMETLMKSNVKVGTLRTQLGVEGYEDEGPLIAAQYLLKFLKGEKDV
jgi:energy-coupling factor transporter ATP-binding protein EcfA2